MSKKKNNKVKKQQGETYAQALSRKKQAHDDWIADIMSQINFDAACFAARDVFHMGPTRAPKFKESMEGYVYEICKIVFSDKDDEELVHSMATLDRGLLKIVGEKNFVPSRIRYVGR